jgi:hypothetical protein
VFLWPSTSCDPGGYYTLATVDGRFLGNVSASTQLRAVLPPGQYTILGWNESREDAQHAVVGSVPVLHATLAEGLTYFVYMSFGEWDDAGPHQVFAWRSARRLCFAPDHHVTAAMVTLNPASNLWDEVPTWTAELETIAPDQAAGQAWLDRSRDALASHRDIAVGRFEGLRPRAKRMATLEVTDGMSK